MKPQQLCGLIRVAKGDEPADMVLKGCRILNLFTNSERRLDVAISGGFIAGLGEDYSGRKEISMQGAWVLPGFMDAHIHLESSMLHPARLAQALLPRGTTTMVCDPHEIANVLGIEGVRFLLEQSSRLPFDIYFMAPSCVPATGLETSGATLGPEELSVLRQDPRVLGLAEVMNFPGVLACQEDILEKVAMFQDRVIDGHCPGLSGYPLQAYISTGIASDHETVSRDEALEKLESGMTIMIREGSTARNLDELISLVNGFNVDRFCLVSDDLNPSDILERGHLDFLVRKAVDSGLEPGLALRLVTRNPASYYGLKRKGAVAPGYMADIVVVDDIGSLGIIHVFKSGVQVVREGELNEELFQDVRPPEFPNSMKIAPISPASFVIPYRGGKARVIGIVEGQIYTESLLEEVKVEEGRVVAWPERDIVKLAVIERHTCSGRIGLGLVKGLGLRRGALASSIAHDSHNLLVAGVDDRDMFVAAMAVKDMGGGIAVARDGAVVASLALEIGGLITWSRIEDVVSKLNHIRYALRELGSRLQDPVMALSFLALPVIPELKLTDRGLVDTRAMAHVSLFAPSESPLPGRS